MFTANKTITVSGQLGRTYQVTTQVEAGNRESLNEPIPLGSTNLEIGLTMDVSQIKMLAMQCDQDVTVKTNNTSPVNLFTLKAGVPFIWVTGGAALQDTVPANVTVDITKLYVTNASGVDATFSLDALVDPTV